MADWLAFPNWRELFLPQAPLLEVVVRDTVIYLGLFAMMRFILKREAAGVSITDLLVAVILADASQNSLAPDSKALADGLLLVATIIFWSAALNWPGFHFPVFGRIVHPKPLELVREGRPIWDNLKRELMTQLRMQGKTDLSEIEQAWMEGDGRISVVPIDGEVNGDTQRKAA